MPSWQKILKEIQETERKKVEKQVSEGPLDIVRRKYLRQLHNLTKRNVIAYYSGWLDTPDVAKCYISDFDKEGFMNAVHGLKRDLGLDLLLRRMNRPKKRRSVLSKN